jgi:hypothetical protein
MALAHSPKIVTDGLVLCLDAANPKSYPGSGTTWADLSGSGNNGTLTNGPTFNSSNGGNIVFDGVNDYVLCPRPSSIVTSGSITVCLWAKWTTTTTIQALVDNNHSSNPIQGFVIQDRPDLSKALTFSVFPSVSGVVSTFQVGNGYWHHIVGTNDTVTSKLYIDGVLNNSALQAGLATVQPNISIGYWQFGGGRYLNGSVPSLQIYNRALTAAEIQQNFNATRGRYGI